MSKKKTYINPKYSVGNERRKNVRQIISDQSNYLYGAQRQGLLGSDTRYDEYLKSAPVDKDIYPTIDENGQIIRKEEPDTSIFDNFNYRNEHSSLMDAWRMTFEKGYQSRYLAKAEQLQKINDQLDDVKGAQDYKDQLEKVYNLEAEMRRAQEYGANDIVLKNYQNKLEQEYETLDQLEQDIFSRWKKSDVFLDLFTNTDRYKDPRLTSSDTYNATYLYNIGPTGNPNYNGNFFHDAAQGTKRLFDAFGNVFAGTVSAAKTVAKSISGEENFDFLKRAIKNSPDAVTVFDGLFDSYKSHSGESKNHIGVLQSKIDKLRNSLERDQAAKKTDLKQTLDIYRNGNWLFDPKKIDPIYKKMQEEEDRGILKTIVDPSQWLYAVPELGSSFSDFVDFTGLMLLNGGAEYVASKLATTALMTNPLTRALYEGSVIGGSLYFTNQMRRMETDAEATDAYSNRLIQDIQNNGVDLGNVLTQTNSYLKGIGIDSEGLNTLEQLQLALAYNAPTDDSEFNKLKKDARTGIAKVINENNSLSYLDYLQTLPFMNYSRGIIGKFGSGVFGRQLTPRMEKIAESMAIAQAAKKTSNGIIDNLIDRAAGKVANNLATKAAIARTSKYIKNKAKTFGMVGLVEGVEEGQQQLLQNRFARGEYDGYDRYESVFDIPSAFEDIDLAFDALRCYWGLNSSDPDNSNEELIKAMNIGAVTGMMFGLGHTLTNIMPTDQDNVRNLAAQLRNDAVIRRIVADQQQQRQDDEHVSIFYDSFSKAGVNAKRLNESLSQIKRFKGDLVDDADIDRDMQLMQKAWNAYKNPLTQDILSDIGIKKDSELHKIYVQEAVREAMRLSDIAKKGSTVYDKIEENLDHKLHVAGGTQEEAGSVLYGIVQKIKERHQKSIGRKVNDLVADEHSFRNEIIRNAAEQNLKDRGIEYTIADIDEEARQILTDKKAIQKLVTDNLNGFDLNTQEAFVEEYIQRLFDSSLIDNANQLIDHLKNKESHNEFLRKLFGEDIDVESLDAVIRHIEETRDRLKEREDVFMGSINDAIEAHNKIIRKQNKQRQKEDKEPIKELERRSIKDLLKDLGEFEDQEEINKLQMLYLMNDAMEEIVRPYNDAFAFGETNPEILLKSMKRANWSELSQTQKDALIEQTRKRYEEEGRSDKFKGEATARTIYNNEVTRAVQKVKDLVKKRKEIQDRIKNTPQQERSLADIDDLRAVSKEAAKLFIQERINKAQERKNKAIEETPITPDDIEAAEAGDEAAAKKVAGAAELIEDVATPGAEVEMVEKKREVKSAITDELADEVGDVIAGEDFEKTKKKSKRIREKEEEERKAKEQAEMKRLEGIELTKYMVEHPELMANAFDNPANFLNDYDIAEHLDELRNGQVLFYYTDEDEKTHYMCVVIRNDYEYEDFPEGDIYIQLEEYGIVTGIPTYLTTKIGFNLPHGYVVENENDTILNVVSVLYSSKDKQKHQLYVIDTEYNDAILHKPGVDTGTFSDTDPDAIDGGKGANNDDDSGQDPTLDSEEKDDNKSNIEVSEADGVIHTEDEPLPVFEDPSSINVEQDGTITVNGVSTGDTLNVNPDTLEVEPDEEQQILVEMESAFGVDYTDYVSSMQGRKNRKSATDSDDVGQFIESTFFYDPEAEDPMILSLPNGGYLTETRNGKIYFDGKEVRPGKEFGQKLAQKGWLENIPAENKYYVVSQHKGNPDKTNPDGFTVTLVVEDGDVVYMASIRTPEKYSYETEDGEVKYVDGVEDKIKPSLRRINVDMDEFEDNLNDRIEDTYDTVHPGKQDKPFGVKIGWFNRLDKDDPVKKQIILQARMRSAKKLSRPILAEEEIDRQIEALKQNRLKIIDAYCDKDPKTGNYIIPTEIRKTVHPDRVEISNGRINNGAPFHSAVNSEDTVEIQDLIDENKIRIGYGKGGMRYIRDKFAIVNLFPDKTTSKYDGKGFSGKLYMIVEGPAGIDTPVQLHEAHFDTQTTADGRTVNLHKSTDNLKLGITLNAKGFGEVTSTTSAAEVLLYLICNKLSVSELPIATFDLQKTFVELFINCSNKTIMKDNQLVQNGFPKFAAKQLSFEDGVFTIGEQDEDNKWHPVPYEMNEIFGDSAEQIATRRKIIYQIAENMHWNTSQGVLINKFSIGLLRALQTWFNEHPEAESFKLCGVDQFEFKKSDLFETKADGKIKRQKNVSVLSWMLKNNKLTVDTQEQMFYAPFLFADGVAQNKKDEVVKKGKPKAKSVVQKAAEDTVLEESLADIQAKIDNVETKLGKGFIATTEERKKEILDSYYDTQSSNGGLEDILAVDLGQEKFVNIEDAKKKIHQLVDEYIEKSNKNRDEDKQIVMKDSDWESIDQMTKLNLKSINNNKVMPVFYVTKNGTGSTLVMSTIQDIKADANITGVASKYKSPGKFNEKRTKEWIKRTLGLRDDQSLVVEGVIKSCSDGDVYGLTQLCCDMLDRPFVGFTFSEQAGRGIGYHEAWHYVNLLLHNEAERLQIYRAYVKLHPELKDEKFKVIEEHLAEDFRKYGEMRNEKNITNVLKRWYNNLLDFLFSYRKEDLIRSIFDSIQRGDYAGATMDEASIQEFKKVYPEGIARKAEYSYPGVRQDLIDNIEGINDYHTFYQVGVSLANKLLEHYDIQTIEDLSSINAESFKQFMQNLYRKNQTERNVRKKKIVDSVIKNSAAFKVVADSVLKQYGVTPKYTKRGKLLKDITQLDGDQEQNREPVGGLVNKEDAPTNIWDIESIEVSKKANVAFRAKLFLSQIPDSYWQTKEIQMNGKTKYTRQMTVRTDDIIGATVYVPYGKAWNKVMNALWQVESFGKQVNGKYVRSSIMGVVERRKEAEPFFAQLWERLKSIEGDIQLESQIFCTVASAKNQIASLQLSDKKMSRYEEDAMEQLANEDPEIAEIAKTKDSGSIADRMRVWDMFDDNNLRAKKNLPRVWSKTAVASGMIEYTDKKSIVSKTYSDQLQSLVEYNKDGDSIMQIIEDTNKKLRRIRNSKKREDFLDSVNDTILDKLSLVLNLLGIPFDRETLNYYIQMHLDNPSDLANAEFKYRGIKNIMDNGTQPGGIRYFVNQIKESAKAKRDFFVASNNKSKRAIDQLFTGYSDEYEITKMAQAFNTMNPSSSDFSVVGPDGDLIYPMSQNNFMSDAIRWLNNSSGQRAFDLMQDPYARHSVILDVAKDMQYDRLSVEDMFKLDTFVGIKDSRSKRGNDYFGITPMEDYIAKMFMLFKDRLVLPTMADKKTWYAIKFGDNVTRDGNTHITPHEVMRYSDRTYSGDVIKVFAGYFRDELDALKQYYNRENIQYLIDHPGELRENFHGDVKNGRMDFSGNGGKFRYFYDIYKINGMNLNEMLQFEYNRQQAIESGAYKSKHGIAWLYEDENELDGFELIRRFLDQVEQRYFGKPSEQKLTTPEENLTNDITTYLNTIVDSELKELARPGSLNMVTQLEDGRYVSRAIPYQILDWYANKYFEKGYIDYKEDPYSQNNNANADFTLSAITNNVLGSMMSVIEMEKVFSGDPAFYKWKYKTKKGTKEKVTREVTADVAFEDGVIAKFTTQVDILAEKHTDKIKRLGSVLSPGENLNVNLSEAILKEHPELRGTKYTNLNVSDAIVTSQFVEEITGMFERSALVDVLRNTPELSQLYTEEQLEQFYTDEKKANKALSDLKVENKQLYDSVKETARQAVNPYTKINMSDAQVMIRPALYRKIRIELGEWSFLEDADGYSDEKAYNILESDSEWMRDSEKAAIVARLQLKPLKMTYFMNDPLNITGNTDNPMFSNLPVYNKMAIFPLFRYAASSVTGKQLYDRMNMEGNEIDMVTFESAVKVGGHQHKYQPFENKTTDISTLDEALNKKSSVYLSKEDSDYGDPKWLDNSDGSLLDVQVQDLSGLRLQLNTDAHSADSRAIGTQMFKIAFSNIVEDAMYGERSGKQIRADIMSCINTLTKIGVFDIRDEFYNSRISEDGNVQHKLNRKAVDAFIRRIIQNNGLGASAEEIINNGGVIASLTSRKVFENSTSATVNNEVIDINTKGGSAVQQSIFGFTGYGKKNVLSEENFDPSRVFDDGKFPVLNGGKELKWFRKDGHMEVMLSMNFFKSVIPQEEQTTYENMRKWLFDHGIIGTKSKPYGVGYRIPTQGMSSMFSFVVADVLPQQAGDLIIVPREFTAQTGSDFDVDKIYMAFMSYTNGKYDSIPDHIFHTIMNTKKSFLSLEEVFGDKANEVLSNPDEWDENRQMLKVSYWKNAIANRLLNDYITVISDIKNFADARASIDTITNKIGDDLLPLIREQFDDYRSSGYELMPSFQSNTKREFKTGKDGISPFALHITNMAMTQFTNMCMDYKDNEFGFGNLDAILGKDNIRISAWLSAMVNAHVDVAKDPYVFALNVNKATYNHCCFLLRAGMGLSTFTFLSQPILKEYAEAVIDAGGFYGQNIDGSTPKTKMYTGRKQKIYRELVAKAKNEAEDYLLNGVNISKEERKQLREKLDNLIAGEDVNWKEVFDEEAGKKALKDPNSAYAKYFQYLSIQAFEKISNYADELSRLVHLSQIDTKKFGNDIALQINFENSINLFKYGDHKVRWYINNEEGRKYMKEHKDDKSYAARKYFGSLFLDDKFSSAKNFTRQILSRQTYVATNEFDFVFKSLMQQLNGTKQVTQQYMSDGVLISKPLDLYGEVKDEDLVKAMAQAIDNIMRYRVLMHNGVKTLNRFKRSMDQGSYSGPIDFTFDGDPQILSSELERLFNGIKDSEDEYSRNSIFKNVANLIRDIRNNGFDEKYEGLTDPNTGEITNDLLKFLLPQLPSSTNEVGRMLLYKNQMSMEPDEKRPLIAAFDQLLRHPNKDIRRIARDVAVYAYYSTYDVSSPNSFFDLVPSYYRKQYDLSLKMGLMASDDMLSNLVSGDEELGIESDIFDIIARNFWYDDNIVPVYYEHKSNGKISSEWVEKRTHTGRSTGKSRFSGAILTSYADSPYIKVVKGDDVMLYKNVGYVQRTPLSEDTKTPKNRLSVYMAIPRLGYHNGNIHHYEFSGNEHIPSIFKKQNKISLKFEREQLEKDVQSFLPKNGVGKVFKYEIIYDKHMPYVSEQMYFKDNSRNNDDYLNDSGNLRFVAIGDKSKTKKKSTVVIDINNDSNEDLKNRVGVNFEDSTQDIIDAIVEKIGDVEKPILYFSNSDIDVEISKKEVKVYADEMVALQEQFIREASTEGISEPHLKEELKKYRENNKKYFEIGAKQRKMNQKMFDVLSGVVIAGRGKFQIRGVYAEGTEGLGAATANAIMLTTGEYEKPNSGGRVLIDEKYKLLRNNEQFQDIRDQFAEPDDSFVSADWQQQQLKAIRDFVDAADEITADIQKLSDSVAEQVMETVKEVKEEVEQEKPKEDKKKKKEKSVLVDESEKKDESLDADSTPLDANAFDDFFGVPKLKKYYMMC